MLSQLSAIFDIFWSPRFWFGKTNLSWTDFEAVNTSTYELVYPIPIAILLLITRGLVNDFVFKKLGEAFGFNRNARGNSAATKELETLINKDKKIFEKRREENPLQEIEIYWKFFSVTVCFSNL